MYEDYQQWIWDHGEGNETMAMSNEETKGTGMGTGSQVCQHHILKSTSVVGSQTFGHQYSSMLCFP